MFVFPVFVQADRRGCRAQPSQNQLILGVTPDGVLSLISPSKQSWNPPILRNILTNVTSPTNQENFEINLDVHHFAPDDIYVKTVDGFLIIEAAHAEKRDEFGWVKRQFTRRYALPERCNIEAIESRLSSDGVLTVVAPLEGGRNERTVPIIQTGPVRSQAEVKADVGDGEAPETITTIIQ